ncbi:MAG: hypothetical protein M3N19_00640 [Candidatus Eremiobacteraeota bacterium]|nr:hypothetical protein [Candidatus Eremiobacteraeota bacterium]
MVKRILLSCFIAVFSATSFAGAAMKMAPAKLPDTPVRAEVQFVNSIQADLMKRFPTAADAEKAGYFRYTTEDNTGAISYANLAWQSVDAKHPSQLWYDVNGNLLGADFSVLKSNSPKPPKLWGVNPRRWLDFKHPHYHFVVKDAATGVVSYAGVGGKKYVAAGGVANSPTADIAVKMGKAKSAAEVVKVFTFPALWDLMVWVKDNPKGAFAEKNPSVTPSKDAEKDSM